MAKQTCDFAFILRPQTVLNKAVEALSDPHFNPEQKAVVQVGEYGFELTVSVNDPDTGKKITGYLRLNSTELLEFRCNKPLQKIISLKSVSKVLKDSAKYEHDSVSIFSEDGSDRISFQWSNGGVNGGFGFGIPISIELQNFEPERRKFPIVVTYGFEAVIPSKTLIDVLGQVVRKHPESRPTDALATLNASTVRTVHMKLNNNIVLSTEKVPEKHEVWLNWPFWETLKKASVLADKCSMYLATNPSQNVMLRFKLDELGDFVYLMEAQFLSDNTLNLSFLGLY